MRRRFHLCTVQDEEALQSREKDEGERSSDRNAHQPWSVPGKWESVVAPSSSRCQAFQITAVFCTTASCLITLDLRFCLFSSIAALSFHLVSFTRFPSYSSSCVCSFVFVYLCHPAISFSHFLSSQKYFYSNATDYSKTAITGNITS